MYVCIHTHVYIHVYVCVIIHMNKRNGLNGTRNEAAVCANVHRLRFTYSDRDMYVDSQPHSQLPTQPCATHVCFRCAQ